MDGFCGIVLAGGQSKRMGKDKAGLLLGGRALLDLQLEKLKALGATELLVSVGAAAAYAEKEGKATDAERVKDVEDGAAAAPQRGALPGVGPAGARPVPDAYPDRGPLGGIACCLAAAKESTCLVIGVDIPLISPATLSEMLNFHRKSGRPATVLSFGGRKEPLIAVYEKSLAAAAGALISKGPAPVRALLEKANAAEFAFSGNKLELLNCNTPEDLATVIKLLGNP